MLSCAKLMHQHPQQPASGLSRGRYGWRLTPPTQWSPATIPEAVETSPEAETREEGLEAIAATEAAEEEEATSRSNKKQWMLNYFTESNFFSQSFFFHASYAFLPLKKEFFFLCITRINTKP
jgi:hypothetical protein